MNDRYAKQMSFTKIGEEGQKKLKSSSVAIIGCGGLGSISATLLVRAGVGRVRIIDRDFVEYHNLHRQILYDEDDVRNRLPKAVAAERHLRKVNSMVEVEGIVADVSQVNIEVLVQGVDLILGATDNLESRFLINDTSLKLKIPWVYGGVVGSYGMSMNIIPYKTPCFRCIYHILHYGNSTSTEGIGIISPAPVVIGTFQTVEAMKILIEAEEINRDLIITDVWKGTYHRIMIDSWEKCPSCHGKLVLD